MTLRDRLLGFVILLACFGLAITFGLMSANNENSATPLTAAACFASIGTIILFNVTKRSNTP